MNISIIIPTYNRCEMLDSTIASFVEQKELSRIAEIIVADNNSTDNTKDVVEQWSINTKGLVKYFFEKRQGVHYARNSAAKISTGEILYFTDDDMIADKNLVFYMIKVFEKEGNIGCATGLVLPKWEHTPPNWITKYCYNGLLSLRTSNDLFLVSEHDLGVFSCHQAVLRDAFFQSGGFNPENTGGEWIGDGETGLNIKLKELGYLFASTSNSIIYHIIPKERMTQKYLNKRLGNQGNCDSFTCFRKNRPGKPELCLNIFNHLANLLKCLIVWVINFSIFRDNWHMNLGNCYYYLSRIKYDMKLIFDNNWREFVLVDNWLERDR